MKQHGQTKATETVGVSTTRSFKINASAKAFGILSSGLYARKIEAFVRELSCNARDAHVDAGTTNIPIDVKIPNRMSSNFYIRDYGTGLSEDDINSLYTTYFESTKSDSNDFIGAMGLGSKSPFSYVDSFTVVSYFDGQETSYICFIDESGMPNITKVTQTNTDQPSGMKIEISIQPDDIEDLKVACIKIYSILGVEINFVDSHFGDVLKNTLDTAELDFENEHMIVYNRTITGWHDHTIYALMGGVAYPISSQTLTENGKNLYDKLKSAFVGNDRYYSSRHNKNVFIKFKLGDVDVAASREELQYDKITIKNIEKKFEEIVEFASKEYEEDFKKFNTPVSLYLAKEFFETSSFKFSSKGDISLSDGFENEYKSRLNDLMRLADWETELGKHEIEVTNSKMKSRLVSLLLDAYRRSGIYSLNDNIEDKLEKARKKLEKLKYFVSVSGGAIKNVFVGDKLPSDMNSFSIRPKDFIECALPLIDYRATANRGVWKSVSHENIIFKNVEISSYTFASMVSDMFRNVFVNDTNFSMRSKPGRLVKGYLTQLGCFKTGITNNDHISIIGCDDIDLIKGLFCSDYQYLNKISNIPDSVLELIKPVQKTSNPKRVHGFKFDLTSKKNSYYTWPSDYLSGRDDGQLEDSDIQDNKSLYFSIKAGNPIILGKELRNLRVFETIRNILLEEGYTSIYFHYDHRKNAADDLIKNKKHIDTVLQKYAEKFFNKRKDCLVNSAVFEHSKKTFIQLFRPYANGSYFGTFTDNMNNIKNSEHVFKNTSEILKNRNLDGVNTNEYEAYLSFMDYFDFDKKDVQDAYFVLQSKLSENLEKDYNNLDRIVVKLISSNSLEFTEIEEITRRLK